MNSAIRAVDRLRPLIVVGAIGMHAIAAASIPAYVGQVSQLFDESAFVDLEAVTPAPEVLEVPPPEPERIARPTPRDEPCERPPVAATEPPPVVVAAPEPVAETPPEVAAAPSDPLTANGGSVSIATTGNVGAASGNGTSTSELASSTTAAVVGPVIDRRALYRQYRADVSAAIGRLPPLRGTREQIDATVVVGMRVASDGRISDVHVVRTSGHAVVDQHVLEFFRGKRLPAPPTELGFDGREFTYQVRVGT